jgi:hypothetical protein
MAGNLDQIRDASRAAVHAQFALLAIIRDSEGLAIGEAHVRLHLADSRPFGDLDREGFVFAVEGKNMLVFDQQEWVPQDNQVVDFGRGRVYLIEHVQDEKTRTRYPRCVAVEKLP